MDYLLEHKHLIVDVNVVEKLVNVLQNVERAVDAKIHPIKVGKAGFTLRRKCLDGKAFYHLHIIKQYLRLYFR